MLTSHEAIREVVTEARGRISAKEVVSRINQKYPGRWKESTIYTHLYGCSVNNPRAYVQHPSMPKFLFDHRGRTYQLYNPEIHGQWGKEGRSGKESAEAIEDKETLIEATITLERDLEEYIVRNLDQIEDGLKLYSKEGTAGRQFNTDVGRIDILALDKRGNFVTIELKAGMATYAVIGQLLGYMNWIRRRVAEGKQVRGMIIADDFDTKLRYAVSETPSISLKKYEVNFTFKDANTE